MTGPFSATGGSTILTLEPSSRWVSSIGTDSFTSLFDTAAIRCATSLNRALFSKCLLHRSSLPHLSRKISCVPLTIISVMESSSKSSCNTSNPRIAANISLWILSRSSSASCISCFCLIFSSIICPSRSSEISSPQSNCS